MSRPNQNGFEVIGTGLVVLVVSLLIGTGFYVWNAQKNSSKASAAPPSNKSQTASINSFEDCKKAVGSIIQETFPETCVTTAGQHFTGPSDTSAQKYLVIKEWGVKIPLAASNADAYYHITKTNPNGAYVSVMSVAGVSGCALSDGNTTGSGVIFRFKHDDISDNPGQTNQTYLSLLPKAVKIGDYYYWYQKDGQAVCTQQPTEQAKISAASTAFSDNITSIQPE